MKEFFKQRIYRGLVRRLNNLKIARTSYLVSRIAPAPSGQPIAFFKASTGIDDLSWNSGFHLLASWALRLQGIPVAYFACNSGMSKCVLGTNRDQPHKEMPCKTCVMQARALYAGVDGDKNTGRHVDTYTGTHVNWFFFERDPQLVTRISQLSLPELSTFHFQSIPLGPLCLPALRWVLRIHHLNDDENTRYLLREYILSAWNVARKFETFLDATNPRAVVVFNGQFFPEATAAHLARKRGIRVITHEVGFKTGTAFFTDGEATIYPIHIPDSFEMSERENNLLDEYLAKRFQGDFTMAGIQFWTNMKKLDESFLKKAAGFQQIVPIFTNVIFDTSQPHANVVFEDMFHWLDETLSVIRKHPQTLFVIRAHPDEMRVRKSSRETVGEWVTRHGVDKEANVIFISPRETLSSYDLIQRSKFVMVYNSTIGLEASILGVPVLCAGRARFTQYPTVFFPRTVEEQRATLEEFLNAEKIETPAGFTRNARRFLYYQVFRSSLPFDDFLEPSVRTTQTRLKKFDLEKLSPANSRAMRTIFDGLLNGGDFLMRGD
ncbi:MAG: hypothetical protein HFACDABA_02306 [Anaerolineales bacterium]|nr:hypothetical protein [Anaerolineales bacterium]